MINQRNKLMTYFLPRSGRFLAALCAGFSVQRRNQMLLSAVLLLSSFALLPTASAQTAPSASQITDLSVTVGDKTITLSWTPPNLNGGTFVRYEILSFGGDEQHNVDDYSSTSETLPNPNNIQIPFTIRTVTSAGNSAQSNAVTATPTASAQTAPSQITDLAATAGVGAVTLTWTPPKLNGGTFNRYDIFYEGGDANETILEYSPGRRTITLPNTQPETFTIRTQTSEGLSSVQSNEVTISALASAQAFPTPVPDADLTAVVGDEQITVNWIRPVDGASPLEDYEIILKLDAGEILVLETEILPSDHTTHTFSGALINGIPANMTTLYSPSNGVEYIITLAARNAAGISGPVATVRATPAASAQTAPAASQITDLSATAGVGTVTLTWTPPNLNGGTFSRYDIFYEDDNANETILEYSTDRITLPIPHTRPETFKIRTQTSAGFSAQSNEVTISALASSQTAPGALSGVMITPSPGQVALSWVAAGSGATPTTHRIRITPPEGEVFDEFADGDVTEYIVRNLSIEGVYGFAISAGNTIGYGPPLTTSVNVISGPTTAPGQVTGLTAVAGNEKVTLSWDAPDNGRSIIGYGIRRLRVSDNISQFQRIDTTETTLTWRLELSNGTEYSFSVYAITDAENGPYSAKVIVTPTLTEPVVSDLEATPNAGQVVLTWRLDDGGSALTGYVLTVTPAVSPPPPAPPAAAITSDGGSTFSHAVRGLTNGTSYTFSLSANNAVDDGPVVSATATPATKPGLIGAPPLAPPPSATPGDTIVTLRWTPPTDTGGAPLVDYDLTIVPTPASGSGYPRPSGMDTEYIATGLTNGTEYQFFLTQRNAAKRGDGIMLVATPNLKPGPVTDLTAAADDASVTLSWIAPVNNGRVGVALVDYVLEVTLLSDGSVFTPEGLTQPSATAITHPVPGLTNGIAYSFSLSARNADEVKGAAEMITATPLAPFVKVGNDDGYKLTFGPPSTTGETSSFKLYALPGFTERSSLQAGYTASMFLIQDGEIKYTKDTTYGAKNPCRGGRDRSCNTGPAFLINNVDSNVNPSQDLTIKIEITKAGDIGNDVVYTAIVLSSYLIENSLFSIPNSQITDFTATAGVGEITLTWTAPELNGGTFENYTITYGGETKKITSHSTTSTTISNLNNGEEYTFTISATTDLGTSLQSDEVIATPLAPQPPSRITDLSATVGVGTITLTWTAPDLNGGTFILYDIFYEGGDANETIHDHSTTSRTLTFPNVAPQTFTIRTQNSVGISSQSNAVTISALASDVYTLTVIQSDNGEVIEFQLAVTKSNEEGSESFSLRSGYTSTISLIQDAELKYTEDYQVSDISASCKRFDRGCPLGPYFTIDKDDSNIDHLQDLTIKIEIDKANNSATDVVYTAQRDSAFLLDNIFPELKPAPPSQITDFTATAGVGEITLTWTAPDLNNNGDVVTYTITYNDNNGVEQIEIVDAPTTEKLITNLANGHSYIFSITATNNIPLTSAPATVTITTLTGTPSKPTNLQASRNGGVVNITWEAPTDDGGSDITGYRLPHPTGGAVEISKTIFKYFFTLSADNTYDIVVIARNVNGLGAPATVTVNALVELPSQITDFTATPLDGGVDLFWTSARLNGGTFENYTITYGDQTKSLFTHSTTSTTIPDLNNGEEYTFTITATTDLGTSTPSDGITATPIAAPTVPAPVTGLETFSGGARSVGLKWTAPVDSGGSAFNGYTLTLSPSRVEGEASEIITIAKSAVTMRDGFIEYTVSGLKSGTPYNFSLVAMDVDGNTSTAVTITGAEIIPPEQPTDLIAVGGLQEITLSWTRPANTGGAPLVNYELTVTPEGGTFFQISIDKNVDTYTVTDDPGTTETGLANGTKYDFLFVTSNGSEKTSPLSLSATPGTPPQVTNLTAVASDGGIVTLSWNAPANNGASEITAYKFRIVDTFDERDIGSLTTISIPDLNATQYTHSITTSEILDVINGFEYEFHVIATNDFGDGADAFDTATPDATIAAPDTEPPVIELTDGDVTLNFGDTYTEPGFTATDNVDVDADIVITPRIVIGGTTVDTVDTNTVGIYTITYSAMDIARNNAIEKTRTVTVNATEPQAVTTLTVVAGDSRVTLNWTAPTDNGGSPITAYILKITGGEGVFAPLALPKVVGPHTDSRVINGTSYTFTLVAVNAVGQSSLPPGPALTATPSAPVTAPQAVTTLTAVAGDETVTLNWTAPVNNGGSPITDYKLRIVDSNGTEIAPLTALNSTATTHTVTTGLTNGTAYEFHLRATNAEGDSAAASATATPVTVPQAVTNLTAVASDGQVTLSWTAPVNNGGSAITDYKLEILDSDGAEIAPLTALNSTATTHTVSTGLSNGTAYEFHLRATNAVGDSADVFATATPVTVPEQVTGLTAVAGNRQVTLNWTAPVNNGGSEITDYKLQIVDTSNRTGTEPLTALGSTATTHTVSTGLTNRTAYEFHLRATNAAGDSADVFATATPAPATAPGRVTNLRAVAGKGQVELNWMPPDNDGGSPINGYGVRIMAVGRPTVDLRINADVTTYTATDLTPGVRHAFFVGANNAAGNGRTTGINATPAATAPGAVTNLTAVVGDGQVRLNWTAPVNNGGSEITDYKLQIVDTSNRTGTEPLTALGSTNTTHTVTTGLSNGTAYEFHLRATNTNGDSASEFVPATPAVPAADQPPDAVIDLTAEAGNTTVTLSWIAPAKGGSDIIDYEIKTVRDGLDGAESVTLEPLTVELSSLTLLEGRTTYTVLSLVNGNEHNFSLTARNAAEKGPAATATETPGTVPAAVINLVAEGGNTIVTLRWDAPDNGGAPITYYGISITKPNRYTHIPGSGPNIPGSGPKTSLQFDNTANGTTYTFEVFARNRFGDSPKVEVSGTSGAPGAVTGLTAVANDDGTVTLSWALPRKKDGSVSNGGFPITGYKLQIVDPSNRTGTEPLTALGSTNTTHTVTTGLTNGTAYEFHLRATNTNGDSAAVSASATPVATATAPQAVTGLTAVAGDGQVTLNWTAPVNNGGSEITDYKLQIVDTSNRTGTEPLTALGSTATTHTVTTGLSNGTAYEFHLRATNAEGDSAATSATATPVTVPEAVTNLTAVAGNRQVTLSWTAPVNNGGSEITDYKLQIVDTSNRTGTEPLTALGSTATTHTVTTGLSNGTAYEFHLRATNAVGDSADVFATATPVTVPEQVTGLTAVAGNGQVTLNWTAPVNNGGSEITGYKLQIVDPSNRTGTEPLTALGSTNTTHTVTTGLSNGTAYEFHLRATNTNGDSASEFVTATPIAAPTVPGPVTDLTAVAGSGQVTLSWTKPNSSLSGYKLQIVDTSNRTGNEPLTALSGIDVNSVNVTHLVDTTGLTNGTEYEFHVIATNTILATNTNGDGPSEFATATAVGKPDQVTMLMAEPGDQEVTLSWIKPANNGGQDLITYFLTVLAGAEFFEIDTIPADADTYTVTVNSDTGAKLTNNIEHTFYLASRNGIDNSTAVEITATPVATTVTVPAPVTGLETFSGGAKSVGLKWTAPVDSGGSAFNGYTLTLSPSRVEGEASEIITIAKSAVIMRNGFIEYTVSGLKSGTLYNFSLVAMDVDGNPSTAVTITGAEIIPPEQPTDLIAVGGLQEITLSWTRPADTGGAPLVNYELTVTPEGGTFFDISIDKNVETHTVTNDSNTGMELINGTKYDFLFVTSNGSEKTSPLRLSATPGTPPQVTNLTAVASDGGIVTLSWNAPANNGASEITAYKFRIVDTFDEGDIGSLTTISIPDLNATQYTHSITTSEIPDLINGFEYEFHVIATNDFGDGADAFDTATPDATIAAPDTEPPVIVLGGGGDVILEVGDTYTDTVTATDNVDVDADIVITTRIVIGGNTVDIVDTSTVGIYTITYSAMDIARNNAIEKTRTVTVNAVATAPQAVTGLTAAPGDGQVTLSWTAPVNNGGSPITDYKLRIVDSNGTEIAPLTALNSTATTHTVSTGLSNGTAYEFQVRATNAVGDSPVVSASATPVATATEPGRVTTLTAVAGDETVTLNWTAPVNNGGSEITDYKLRIVDSNGTEIAPLTALNSTATTQSVSTGLSNGTAYEFQVRATNAVGDSPVVSASATPVAVPDPVTGLTVLAGDSRVTLSWIAPTDNGGSPITGYILRITGGEGVFEPLALPKVVAPHTDSRVINGTSYTFTLVAVNTVGHSPESDPVSATPVAPVTAPQAVTDLTAVAGSGQVTLSWTKPNSSLKGYKLQIVDTSNRTGNEPLTALSGIDVNSVNVTHLVDTTGLTNGTEYEFHVIATNTILATNTNGDGPSEFATATAVGKPDQVTELMAEPGDQEVTLSWIAPASNGGQDLITYFLTVLAGAEFFEIDTIPADADTYTVTVNSDTGAKLTNNIEHTFYLASRNGIDNSTAVEITATPVATTVTVPAPVTGLETFSGGARSVGLKWTAPVDSGGSAFNGYTLTLSPSRVEGEASETIPIAKSAVTMRDGFIEYTVSGLKSGTLYNFSLVAMDVDGNPSTAEDITGAEIIPPEQPTDLIAVGGDGEITLSWTRPADTGGAPLVNYELTVTPEGGTFFDISIDKNVETHTVTNDSNTGMELINGTKYDFLFVTSNGSEKTSPLSLSATPGTPPQVTNLTAVASDGGIVTLSWNAPANNGASEITAYKFRIVDTFDGGDIGSLTTISIPDLNATQYTHSITTNEIPDLINGFEYEFHVIATNDFGDGADAFDTATPDATIAAPDTEPPVIVLGGGGDVILEVGDTYTDTVTATDNVDVDADIVITPRIVIGGTTVDIVDTSTVGIYTITYSAMDNARNNAIEKTRTVTVTADVTKPVITLTGPASISFEVGGSYTEAGATANDNIDGPINSRIVIDSTSVDTNAAGTYSVTYNVSDNALNAADEVTRAVIVTADVTKPVITLTGPASISFEVGGSYTEAGATANDNIDGPIDSSRIVIDSTSVDVNTVGTYSVTYNVSDNALNAADEVTRTVIVSSDVTKPVITLTGQASISFEVGGSYTEAGATANDNIDGQIDSSRIVIDSTSVDVNTVGTYSVTYNVSDNALNAADEVTRAVIVTADVTKPVITLTGQASISFEVGGSYTEAGATANDNIDGPIDSSRIVIDSTSVDTNAAGTYSVTYNVSDNALNAADEVTRAVIVTADVTKPVITLTGPASIGFEIGGSYTEAGATANDNIDGPINSRIVIDSTSVDTNAAGTYSVTYNVSDIAGNDADEVTRTVIVSSDVTKPVITLTGQASISFEVGGSYTEAGATANDNIDGPIDSSRIVIDSTSVDVNTVGTYSVTYNVSDNALNAADEVTRAVIVTADVTKPVITLTGPASISFEVGGSYTEAGATATDNIDGQINSRIVIDSTNVDANATGTYSVTYNVSDNALNAADEVTRAVIVTADVTKPVITLTGPASIGFEIGGSYTEAGATANDNIDGPINSRIVIDSTSVDTNAAGTYSVTYNVSDIAGNDADEVTRTVIVSSDVTKPVITLTGQASISFEVGGSYTEAGATASDNIDGPIDSSRIVIDSTSVDTNAAGTYSVTYNVSDNALNAADEVTRAVIVTADVTKPVITLTGPASISFEVGGSYTEAGATANDNIDGQINSRIVIDSTSVDVNTVGTYSVTYNVSDNALNAADEVTRTVIVTADVTKPVITLTGPASISFEVGGSYTEAGATATDNIDGQINSRIVIDSTSVDTNAAGTYSVTYNVSDNALNAADEVTRAVIVTADVTKPVITLTGPASISFEVGGSYTEAGATATDNIDGPINSRIVIDSTSVDTNAAGTYSVTYNVSDIAGNDADEVTRTVIVSSDVTKPVITLTGQASISFEVGGSYTEAGATANDNIDGQINSRIVIDSTNVNANAVGTYSVTYNVSDNALNAADEVTRAVIVTADVTKPVITLTGPASISFEVGGSYTEAGATANDNIDGPIDSSRIVIDSTNVDVNVVGTYTVTYNVMDEADNAAIERTRTVMVTADMTNPVITQTGSATVILERGSTYTEADVRAGVTATDNIDDDISGDIVIDGSVDTSRIGTYTLTYTVMDSTNNPAAPVIRRVTIVSPIPSANAGVDQLVVPGADVILSGSGTDVKDGAAGVALTYAWELTSGTLASPGLKNATTATARFTAATVVTSTVIYVFTLTVTDSDGNSGTDTVTISVTSEVAITKDIDKQNKVVLPSMGRAIAYQNINAISTRISQVGGANRKNSLGGNTNAVDILKSIERLNKDSSLSAKEALGNSRFAVALDGIGAALWGKIDYQKFKGTDQNVKYDGSLFSSTLGVEGQINNRARLGLALSHTKSDIDYTDSAPIISATSGGDYEIVMLSVNPYISWKPSDDVDLWATLGYGQGDLELILTDSDRLRSSDLRQKTAAVGGSGVVFDNGAIELRLKGEALKTRFEVDKSEGIAALALDAARLRVGLEGSHALSLENGASLNSSVELGVRYDSGDGQTGSRGEVGGRLEYSNGRGLTLEGNARVLVGGGTYDEWGLGGLLKFQPSTDGRGISFNLGLGQGSTVSKTEDIWKNALTNKSTSTANHSTASIKLGYGITAPYWLGGSAYGILTPYTEVKLGNSNSYDLGLDWRIDPSIGFKLNLKNRKKSVNSINLEGEIRF